MKADNSAAKRLALRFVLIIGVVQLFADRTYEGGRGIDCGGLRRLFTGHVSFPKNRLGRPEPGAGFLCRGNGHERLVGAGTRKIAGQTRVAGVVLAFLLGAFFAPFVFLGGFALALVGMILWGIAWAPRTRGSRAMLSGAVPPGNRSTAFGVFDTVLGAAWFAGQPGCDGCTTNPSPV